MPLQMIRLRHNRLGKKQLKHCRGPSKKHPLYRKLEKRISPPPEQLNRDDRYISSFEQQANCPDNSYFDPMIKFSHQRHERETKDLIYNRKAKYFPRTRWDETTISGRYHRTERQGPRKKKNTAIIKSKHEKPTRGRNGKTSRRAISSTCQQTQSKTGKNLAALAFRVSKVGNEQYQNK